MDGARYRISEEQIHSSFLEEQNKEYYAQINELQNKINQNNDKLYFKLKELHSDSLMTKYKNDVIHELHPELKNLLEIFRKYENFNSKHWIKSRIEDALDYYNKYGLHAWVVGLSGGIDSCDAAYIGCHSQQFLIDNNLTSHPFHPDQGGIIIPCILPIKSDPEVMKRARKLREDMIMKFPKCNILKIEIDQSDTWQMIINQIESQGIKLNSFSKNISKSSTRTPQLYLLASNFKGLVIGTGNKNEDGYIFFFCVAGDGRVDYAVIHDLTKYQVYLVAAELGAPDYMQDAVPTADLTPDHTDADEVGSGYDGIELVQRIKTEKAPNNINIDEYLSNCSFEAQEQFKKIDTRVTILHNRGKFKSNANPILGGDKTIDSRNSLRSEYKYLL